MAFGRDKVDAPDGYRPAENGEEAEMRLNGVGYVSTGKPRYSEDDGKFNKGNVGDKHYRGLFGRFSGEKNKDGAGNLLGAEKSALKNGTKNGIEADTLGGQRASEQEVGNTGGLFQNNVKGTDGKKQKKGGIRGFFKKASPALVIAGAICGYGGMSFFGEMAMPFSVMNVLIGERETIGTSTQIRSNSWFRRQANPAVRSGLSDEVKDFTKQHSKIYQVFTGNTNDYFKISRRQQAKLSQAGIEVVTDDSTGASVLRFREANGQIKTIVPDQSMANGSDKVYITDYYEQNEDFHNAYFSGAKTWRGMVGSWYDNVCNKFLSYFGVKRGVWAAYKKSLSSDVDMDNFRTGVESNAAMDGVNGSAETTTVKENTEEVPDGEGGTKTQTTIETDTSSDSLRAGSGSSRAEVAQAANNFITSKVTKLASGATQVANAICLVSDVVGAINLIVMAYQTTQVIKVASSIFEGIQKGQVESSDVAPIHEIGNSLTMRTTNTIELSDSDNVAWGSESEVGTEEFTLTKSAMEASGLAALYDGGKKNSSDPSVKSFNIQNSVNGILRSFGSSVAAYKTCTIAKIGAAVVQGAVQVAEIIGCIASFGIGCLFDALFEAGKQIAISVLQGIVTSVVISAIVPFFANILMRKIATEVAGEDLGNALVSGAGLYMGQNHQFAGGSVGSKESYAKFLAAKEEYEQDRAYYARTTRSPFDYTSQYTFAGSLVNKLVIPLSLQTSSISGGISTFMNTAGKAVSSLMPGASAIDAGVKAQEAADRTAKDCPEIDSIGGVADEFCNPYIVTDMGTTDMDPAEVVYQVSKLDSRNFDLSTNGETDVPKINEKSRLGHYILYCGQRQSPFGLADQNIANDFKTMSTGSNIGDSIIGAVPVVGSLVDIYNNTKVMFNFGYVSGESCVTGNAVEVGVDEDTGEKETSDWSENKYYQRFIEDQRLAENMGLTDKSAITAFLEDYYERNPIDQSYEGVLARRSGLTKDQVIATLDIMEAIVFLADYNPDGYAPLLYEEPTPERISLEDVYQKNMDRGIISSSDSKNYYEERRIRSFAA